MLTPSIFLSNSDVPVPKDPVADRVGLILPFAISRFFSAANKL